MHFSIPELVSEEHSLGVFFLVSVAMGGGAAWLAGIAIARTWRPWWHLALYMLLLALAVRFIHFALFDSKFLSVHYYLIDFAVCLGFGLLGYRVRRVRQMVTRYSWINERAGLLRWRRRDNAAAADTPKSG
jgi:Domain of unknown function (DUF6867)